MSPSQVCLCQGLDCRRPATLQCPSCLKLKIPGSFFCSQDCFKKNWGTHKAIHKLAVVNSAPPAEEGGSDPWPGYRYTGPLRPHYPLSPRRAIPEHIVRPDYAETGVSASEQSIRSTSVIDVLSKDDIDKMRYVCQLAREVTEIGLAAIRPGVTTDEIDSIVHDAIIERGAYPSPFNYGGFPKSCCTSVNEVICHGVPDQRPLKDGDIINLDVSIYKDGFHADLSETVPVGHVDAKGLHLIRATRECLEKAIAIVRPGTLYRDLGNVIEKHAKNEGFSVVKTWCGHGIHRLFHGAPSIPHYARNKAVGVMKAGHVFTIEPMLTEGSWRDGMWPDNQTVVTVDGKRSAQFEQTMVVTETGVEVLTARVTRA